MTGYTVHTGTSKKFVKGWDRVFGEKGKVKKGAADTKKPKGKKGGRNSD